MITGGDIVSDLVGIAAGQLYFFFKDLAPLNFGWDLLKTPQFLMSYFDRTNRGAQPAGAAPGQNPSFRTVSNQNSSATFGNQQQPSTTFRQEGNEGSGNRFSPFRGQGHSWGQ